MSKSIGLDFSKFKHVSSDDKSTTLKHYEGHTITLAHKKLSKANQEALKAMADKASAKAEAKGDGKPSTPEHLAEGGAVKPANPSEMSWGNVVSGVKSMLTPDPNSTPAPASATAPIRSKYGSSKYAEGGEVEKKKVLTGVRTTSAARGVDAANKARSAGDASPNGVTIHVADKESDKKDFGKISGPNGEKPSVFANGGYVQHYAEGTPDVQPIPSAIAMDPNAQPTLPPTNPIDPTAKAPDVMGLPDLSAQGVDMATSAASPENRYNFYKKNFDYMSDSDILKAMDKENADRSQAAAGRVSESSQQVNALADIAARKQQAGIPLSPKEQEALQGSAPQSSAGMAMQPDPGVAAAARQLTQGTSMPGAGNPGGMGDVEGMMASGYKNQLAGINQAAEAQGQLGQQQADVLKKQAEAVQTAKVHYDETYNKLDQERQALVQDIQNGHIDPNKYWTGDSQGNGGHSKIMAGIGMILAGFNPTTQPNAAMNFLKYQMDQNLQAQQKNLDSKQNLLAANMRQFGNLKDATEMTRIMQNDIVANQLQAAAATAQTPMAKAAALQAAGKLKMETAPMFQQFAMRRAMMNLSNSPEGGGNPAAIEQMLGYMRMTNPEMAKSMEARYVPGIGLGSIPVPQEARQKLIGMQDMDNLTKDLLDFVGKNTTIVPGTPLYNQGAQKALALQSAVREGKLGTVYREGEQPLLDKFVNSNPANAMKMFNTVPKLKEMLHGNAIEMNNLRKNYGLPQTKEATEPQYAMKGGVKYMKVPGGWARQK